MYNKILVPLDGSKLAEKILPYIAELAFSRESKVILLRVVEPASTVLSNYESGSLYNTVVGERLSQEAESYLTALANELRGEGLDVKTKVGHGAVVQTILNVAEQEQADLIAMASHGRSGLARVFYGSVAAGILSQADRPLLLIRAQEP